MNARAASILVAALAVLGCGERLVPLRPDAGRRPDSGPPDPFHDPTSRPEQPIFTLAGFTSASECGSCHETHFAQWTGSMHAYAMIDPVFRAIVRVRQRDYDGAQDQFCTQCHSAIGVRSGDITDGFRFEDLAPLTLEGVTCDACHRVSELVRPHDSGHVLEPGGAVRGTILEPRLGEGHRADYSPLHASSEFCGGCHDIHELSGMPLERPYAEWLTSPAREDGRSCQSCHMPTYTGRATETAPERALHRHDFVGVDVPLTESFASPERVEEIRAGVRALLEGVVRLDLDVAPAVIAGEQLDLVLHVENLIDGHNLPTGSTFIRQMWLEVVVRDAGGAVVYETGTLDDNGDLRDYFSSIDPYGDDDLISFGSGFIGADGRPEIFSWRAAEHFTRSLPPHFERTFTLFVPTAADTPGPLEVSARVRFRTHAPYLLRALGLGSLVDRIAIYDLAADAANVAVLTSP